MKKKKNRTEFANIIMQDNISVLIKKNKARYKLIIIIQFDYEFIIYNQVVISN